MKEIAFDVKFDVSVACGGLLCGNMMLIAKLIEYENQ